MSNLILNSLEIRGFRGFHHLQIERLGRVNLVVGKNNVGKSSLLDALQLYAYEAYPNLIWQILRSRDESLYDPSRRSRIEGERRDPLAGLKYLFYGRKDIGINAHVEPILIGPVNSLLSTLSLSVGWGVMESGEEGIPKVRLLQPEEYNAAENPEPRFVVSFGEQRRIYSLDAIPTTRLNILDFDCIFIAANGLDQNLMEEFWDRVVLREAEEDILTALRIIAPGVVRLSLVGDTNVRQRIVREPRFFERRTAIPVVKVAEIDEPIPLASLGGGMQRALGIILALVNARDGILLIDEFENGLHYSVQPSLWRLIFQVARRLNVQVFATTHSWDCIEGFQQAAQEDKLEEGVLIRLQSRDGEITATLYDEEELAIATRERIEVR